MYMLEYFKCSTLYMGQTDRPFTTSFRERQKASKITSGLLKSQAAP